MRMMFGILTLILAGCTTSEPPPVVLVGEPVVGAGQVVGTEPAPPVRYRRVIHPGDAVLSVVGSPFLLAFRGVVCAASVVVAAPTAALVSISEPRLAGPTATTLGNGLASNCGPPYVISPYRYVPVVEPVAAPEAGGSPIPLP